MTRRIPRRVALVATLAAALALTAAPASAAPPDRPQIDYFTVTLDLEHDLVVFWNITRDDFCAWEASNFDGPPPVIALIPAQEHTVRGGVLIARASGSSALELWSLDADADLSGPCQDTDGQTGPWATGTATLHANDNDVLVSLTRTNAFGEKLNGSVVDVDGQTWRFTYGAQLRIDRNEEFHFINQRFTLARGR